MIATIEYNNNYGHIFLMLVDNYVIQSCNAQLFCVTGQCRTDNNRYPL